MHESISVPHVPIRGPEGLRDRCGCVVETYERLRHARKARQLDLKVLEERTRVPLHQLRSLESGRFEDLPSGVYARGVVRSYAAAVGLDPEEMLTELAPMLPTVEDPLDGLARVRGFARSPSKAVRAEMAALRTPLPQVVRMSMATAMDCGLLAAIDLGLVAASARMCGVAIERLLAVATPAMVLVWMLIGVVYFFMFAGLAGETPGIWLAGIAPAGERRRPVNLTLARLRGCELALRESSILVELLVATEFGQHCLRALKLGRA
jgi:uncharacterized RDD family membrane protein YckC